MLNVTKAGNSRIFDNGLVIVIMLSRLPRKNTQKVFIAKLLDQLATVIWLRGGKSNSA